MALTASSDIYAPLSESSIRILSLLPGRKGAQIECSLTEIPLHAKNAPAYEALSYMWGPPEPTNIIKLNGCSFIVRSNLFSALNALRSIFVPRFLWIDALCINQVDLQERSAQVAKMSDVYREAKTVVVWLGPGSQTTEWLFADLERMNGNIFRAYASIKDEPGLRTPQNSVREKYKPYDEFWPAFVALCEQPYWKRVWIIQEILASVNVLLVCGSRTLPMKSFAIACLQASDKPFTMWGNLKPPGCIISLEHSSFHYEVNHRSYFISITLKDTSLASLLEICAKCGSECQDPRDRIYGILSLTDDVHEIVPDYGKSLLDLYIEVRYTWYNGPLPNLSQVTSLQRLLEPYSDAHIADEYLLPLGREMPMMLAHLPRNQALKMGIIPIHPSSLIFDVSQGASFHVEQLRDVDSLWGESTKGIATRLLLLWNRKVSNACRYSAWRRGLDLDKDLTFLHTSNFNAFEEALDRNTDRLSSKDQVEEYDGVWTGSSVSSAQNKKLFSKDEYLLEINDIDPRDCFTLTREAYLAGERRSGQTCKFLTSNSALGVGLCGQKGICPGDILCHVEGSDRDFVIVRHMEKSGSFKYIGPAVILDRKQKKENDSDIVNQNLSGRVVYTGRA